MRGWINDRFVVGNPGDADIEKTADDSAEKEDHRKTN
jgi:hypothetical protein